MLKYVMRLPKKSSPGETKTVFVQLYSTGQNYKNNMLSTIVWPLSIILDFRVCIYRWYYRYSSVLYLIMKLDFLNCSFKFDKTDVY
jgi:hypothetical protein